MEWHTSSIQHHNRSQIDTRRNVQAQMILSSVRDRQSCSQDHCLFVYSTRYTNCAANRRYLAYFLLFTSFLWVLKLKQNHNTPNWSKLLQFFVANFLLWSRCQHFIIEWPSFVAISLGHCRYFLAHVACWNLPWQGLIKCYLVPDHQEGDIALNSLISTTACETSNNCTCANHNISCC